MHTCASISASNGEEKSHPDENKHPDSMFETVGVRAAQDQDFLAEAQTYFTLKGFSLGTRITSVVDSTDWSCTFSVVILFSVANMFMSIDVFYFEVLLNKSLSPTTSNSSQFTANLNSNSHHFKWCLITWIR